MKKEQNSDFFSVHLCNLYNATLFNTSKSKILLFFVIKTQKRQLNHEFGQPLHFHWATVDRVSFDGRNQIPLETEHVVFKKGL